MSTRRPASQDGRPPVFPPAISKHASRSPCNVRCRYALAIRGVGSCPDFWLAAAMAASASLAPVIAEEIAFRRPRCELAHTSGAAARLSSGRYLTTPELRACRHSRRAHFLALRLQKFVKIVAGQAGFPFANFVAMSAVALQYTGPLGICNKTAVLEISMPISVITCI